MTLAEHNYSIGGGVPHVLASAKAWHDQGALLGISDVVTPAALVRRGRRARADEATLLVDRRASWGR
jgi:hypothetical protein